jgi:hypothetical protein
MDLRSLIDNLFARNAFPPPGMPAIIKEFFEGHHTAAPRTIHRALTIHVNLLLAAPGHRPGLPEKAVSFHIVPLDPAYKAGLGGHIPANRLTSFKQIDITIS